MLKSLHIENIAVIKNIDIDFTDGFMAFTGETGAGKSIIIDSINLILGSKADRELIRTGETSAMVSALFTSLSKRTVSLLLEAGISPDEEGSLLIQRTVSLDSPSSVKINGRAVSLSLLRLLAPTLVSIHGQNDTLALTDGGAQLAMLDIYSENEKLLSLYKEKYSKYSDIKSQIKELTEKEKERERLREILIYQIKDIDSNGLYEGEEEDLIDRKMKIKHSEKILKNSSFVFKALKGSEKGSVSYLLDRSIAALEQLSDVIPDYQGYAAELRDFLYRVDDVAESVYSEISKMDDEPEDTINQIESALDRISKLKRKYGLTVKDILEFRDNAKRELDTLDNSEDILRELKKEEKNAYSEALALAEELHKRREASSRKIEKTVKESLEFLDMPKVEFFVDFKKEYENESVVLNPDGYDTAAFYISANRGVAAQELSKVASGGELARVMLSLKSEIADKDGVSTVIFDEIDTGVSGKTARKIGLKMRSLSKSVQLISVTHSAQIASLSDGHFLIKKADVNGKTETSVNLLDREGRISELSRILGGINVTEAQRKAALDMLNENT